MERGKASVVCPSVSLSACPSVPSRPVLRRPYTQNDSPGGSSDAASVLARAVLRRRGGLGATARFPVRGLPTRTGHPNEIFVKCTIGYLGSKISDVKVDVLQGN